MTSPAVQNEGGKEAYSAAATIESLLFLDRATVLLNEKAARSNEISYGVGLAFASPHWARGAGEKLSSQLGFAGSCTVMPSSLP